jgi:hypothetical protein
MSAAVGGLIGCGLLTLIVIVAALVIGSLQAADSVDAGTVPLELTVYTGGDAIPTLDLTSEAARQGLLGAQTVTPPPPTTATVILPALPALPAQPQLTPTLPVGWRSPDG